MGNVWWRQINVSGKRLISCLAVIHRAPDEVLLIRRRGGGRWTLPGGRLEPQESWRGCAIRETEEEAGLLLQGDAVENELVLHCKDRSGIRIYYFARWFRYQGKLQNCEPHLHDELAWWRLDALPENMASPIKSGLTAVLQGSGVLEAGFAADLVVGAKSKVAKRGSKKGRSGLLSRLFAYLFPPMK